MTHGQGLEHGKIVNQSAVGMFRSKVTKGRICTKGQRAR